MLIIAFGGSQKSRLLESSGRFYTRILLTSSSFKSFICTLFEQLNSNWHGTSIPPHRLWPISSTLIPTPRSRKYQAIRENLRVKCLTVSSPFTTFTACLSMGLLNSRLATSFSPINGFHKSWKTWYQSTRKRTFPCSGFQTSSLSDCVVTKQTFCICAYIRSNSVGFFQLWASVMKIAVVSYREQGNWLGIFKVD